MTAALDFAKAALASASVASAKAEGDVGLKEADDVVDLLEGDFGVDPGWVLQVLAGFEECLGDLFFALDGGAEAGVDGGVGALHDNEDGVGDAGGVVVRGSSPRDG